MLTEHTYSRSLVATVTAPARLDPQLELDWDLVDEDDEPSTTSHAAAHPDTTINASPRRPPHH
jgi:hypothetical protein